MEEPKKIYLDVCALARPFDDVSFVFVWRQKQSTLFWHMYINVFTRLFSRLFTSGRYQISRKTMKGSNC